MALIIVPKRFLPPQYFPDEAIRREISSLPVTCAFTEAGCTWKGKFHEYQQHKDNCDIIIDLPSCKKGDLRPFYSTASLSPTQSLEINGQCPLKPPGCPNAYDSNIDNFEPKQHLQEGEYSHLSMIANCSQLLGSRKIAAQHHEVSANGMYTQSRAEHGMIPLHIPLQDKVKEVQKMQSWLFSSMIQECKARDEERASLLSQVMELEKQIRSKNAELEDCDFRLSLIENSNRDGSMIWKIPQFSQRKADAENGKCASILSPPFYSGRYGYKMCLRLYIMGNGIGKGTHLSLFFVVMRGEFDNILQWPFTHKVTFKLINQAGGRLSDIVDTFKPDPMNISFRKPKSEMNYASGCPQFISHAVLEGGGFIVDNTLFIKCSIDTSTIQHP